MKYLVPLFIWVSFSARAQQQKWHYGPTAGINLYQIAGKGIRPSLNTGVQIGGFAQRMLGTAWSIQAELLYARNNTEKAPNFLTYYNLNGRSNSLKNISLNYITVPILARYELSQKISLLAGLQYGYLFYTNENMIRNNREAFRKQEWGANLGAQYNIGGFAFCLRASKGISDINNVDQRYSWRSFHIQAGFAIAVH